VNIVMIMRAVVTCVEHTDLDHTTSFHGARLTIDTLDVSVRRASGVMLGRPR
jgi:hypothetical protein